MVTARHEPSTKEGGLTASVNKEYRLRQTDVDGQNNVLHTHRVYFNQLYHRETDKQRVYLPLYLSIGRAHV